MTLITSEQKEEYIAKLSEELKVLRAKSGFTQEQISNCIGISRQTYYAIETGQKKMAWSTFLSLAFIYDSIPETSRMLRMLDVFPDGLLEQLNSRKPYQAREDDLKNLK